MYNDFKTVFDESHKLSQNPALKFWLEQALIFISRSNLPRSRFFISRHDASSFSSCLTYSEVYRQLVGKKSGRFGGDWRFIKVQCFVINVQEYSRSFLRRLILWKMFPNTSLQNSWFLIVFLDISLSEPIFFINFFVVFGYQINFRSV